MYERILFPTDGSENAAAAFEYALDLAETYDATLCVLFVADTNRDSLTVIGTDVVDALEREGQSVVDDLVDRATDRGVTVVSDVVQGDPYLTIVDYVDAAAVDVVVMATHGRTGLDRVLLGSVTERVLRSVAVPVLTVNPRTE